MKVACVRCENGAGRGYMHVEQVWRYEAAKRAVGRVCIFVGTEVATVERRGRSGDYLLYLGARVRIVFSEIAMLLRVK